MAFLVLKYEGYSLRKLWVLCLLLQQEECMFNYAAIPAFFFTKFPTTDAAVTVLWDKFSILCCC